VEPLALSTPIAAFNGGLLVNSDMSVIEQRVVKSDLVTDIIDELASFSLDAGSIKGQSGFVQDRNGSHVDREAWTVKFEPTDQRPARNHRRRSKKLSASATTPMSWHPRRRDS